jgi:hypothetical protein
MEEENFQTWLAHNRNQPLSKEVTRLQSLVARLEARHETDYRRLRRAELEWWSLLQGVSRLLGIGGGAALVFEQLPGHQEFARSGVRFHRARKQHQG